jgi:hypothetical protein
MTPDDFVPFEKDRRFAERCAQVISEVEEYLAFVWRRAGEPEDQ